MSLNIKALELIEKGLSAKTVSKLTESQINILHTKLIAEQVGVSKKVVQTPVTQISQSALKSPQGVAVDGQQIKMDSAGNVVVTKTSTTEEVKEEGKGNKDSNPWAICTAQLGKEFGTRERHLWSAKEKNKYERCVKDVKKSLKEGKNPVSLYLENKIMEIVEKHMPPRITKRELLQFMTESPATAPSKPKTSPEPTTKPGKPAPRPRPKHPGQNPNPGENPAPKAKRKISPEVAKDEVLDLIKNLLEK